MSAIIPYLPWISLGIALIAVLARDGVSGNAPGRKLEVPAGAFIILALIVGGTMFAAWKWPNTAEGLFPTVTGFAIGILLASLSYGLGLLPGQVLAGRSAPIALAAAAVSFAGIYGDKSSLALVFGAAAGGWLLSLGKSDEPNPWAMRSAIYTGCIVACNLLATKAVPTPEGAVVGTAIALVGSLAAILAGALGEPLSKRVVHTGNAGVLTAILGLAFWTGGAYLVAKRVDLPDQTSLIFLGSAVIALIVSWMIPDDLPSSTVRVILAAVLWVSVATASFGYSHGLGMAIALMSGAGMLLVIGNRRALLSLGPLAALVFYRVFREAHPDTSQAFDIGQHYAMIGVLLGALLPVVAQEWLRVTAKRGGIILVAGALWVVLLAGAPIPVAIALSDKGIIGYLVGLGLAAVLEGSRGERSAHSLALGLGLGAAMTLLYDWLQPHLDLDRHGKLLAMSWVLGGVVAAGLLIAIFSADVKFSKSPAEAEA